MKGVEDKADLGRGGMDIYYERWTVSVEEMDRPGVRQVPKCSGEVGKMEETGCKVICGALTTPAIEG